MEMFFCCPACLTVQSAGIETDRPSIQPFLDFSVKVQCIDCSQPASVALREMMFCSDHDWINRRRPVEHSDHSAGKLIRPLVNAARHSFRFARRSAALAAQ